jgi:hypothetical protein
MTLVPVRLDIMQVGMHVYDPQPRKKADAEKIFERAARRPVKWVGGTEAGSPEDKALYGEIAKAHDFKFASHARNDAWIAVRRDFITGGWDTDYEQVLTSKDGSGPHGARGVFSAEWDTEDLGHITAIVLHLLTKGRPGTGPETSVNVPWNKKLIKATGRRAKEQGAGREKIVFAQGDMNIVDRVRDVFFGEPLTTAWDELKKWENTGHGNIDVIASYDPDRRVSAAYCRALDDREFRLSTDHFVVEAGFDVLPWVPPPPKPVEHSCPSCGLVHSGIIK